MNLGKISPDDLSILLNLFPKLDADYAELRNVIRESPEKFYVPGHIKPSWYSFYELPYLEHIAKIIVLIGETDTLKTLAATENPPKSGIAYAAKLINEDDNEPFDEDDRPYVLFVSGLSLSLYFTLKSLLTYGVYLNDLIANVAKDGKTGDKSLFQAIKIDPSVIACLPIATRLSKAVMENDQLFLKKLQRSISGKLTKREDKTYQKIRLVMQVLLESGAPQLCADDLYELFAEQLNIVAKDRNSDVGDVANNLRQFAYQFMKQKSVSQN